MDRVLNAPPVAQLRVRNVHNRVEITPNGSTGPLVAYDAPDSDGDREDNEDERGGEDADGDGPIDMDIDSQSSSQASTGFESNSTTTTRPRSPKSFHRHICEQGLSEPVTLPPEPPGKCSAQLQSRIADLLEKSRRGANLVDNIQRKKTFRNPSIYEKLIVHCDIDELGSNFPPNVFDPHGFAKESYYEELSKKQTEAMNKLEKERKKPEVVTLMGVAPSTKKSKWDQTGSVSSSTGAPRTAPGLVSVPTGTKPVVIHGMGSLPKPKNPVTHIGTSVASRR
ncbi:SAP30-binding protein-like [Tropilaelaps mercedesae]|uniref:SAP30-binding protein-like n=1 Tax=Tropilaelaps mercedesae TaxID=418985 RepID=A0A1V9XRZ6_9ACAR|nr:SAP30-binding protein-like [Tropilaelaps mercedesae]